MFNNCFCCVNDGYGIMKKIIKKVMPSGVRVWLRFFKNWIEVRVLFYNEGTRFLKVLKPTHQRSIERMREKLLLDAHVLEKGIAHVEFKPGSSIRVLRNISENIRNFNELGFDLSDPVYVNALSVVKAYRSRHNQVHAKLSVEFGKFFDEFEDQIEKVDPSLGGYDLVDTSTKTNNKAKTYKELVISRTSIREYSNRPIDLDKLESAISLAQKTPSASNRQMIRLRVIEKKELILQSLKIQGGFGGYKAPPVLLLVTADNNAFMAPGEAREAYVDGGLYSMSLLNALEYEQLGAVALNTMFSEKKARAMRKLLDIPDTEVFILFIAVGNVDDKTPYPKSYRVPTNSFVKYY